MDIAAPGFAPASIQEGLVPGYDPSDAALMAHPRFDEAMFASARSIVSFYRGNWVLNRIANDRGRVVGAFIMLDLHFSAGQRGFTVAQLREQARRYTVCSPNRMTALAALLRVGRFLESVPGPDSRMRKLAPTAQMLRLHRERMIGAVSANSIVNPDLARAIPLIAAHDDVLGDIIRSYLAYWRSGVRATAGQPAIEAVVERDAGLTILFLLLVGTGEGIGYRISDLARHFAISRTHALAIIRTGMEHGLIEQPVAGGPHHGTPRLVAAMRSVFVTIFQVQADAVRSAIRRHACAAEVSEASSL